MAEAYVAPSDEELEDGLYSASHTCRPIFSILDDEALRCPAHWNPELGWHY